MNGNYKENKYLIRNSGIEIFKIISIFIIVISHVVQTLSGESVLRIYSDYIVPLGIASSDSNVVTLNIMRSFGVLGNAIFFVCSAFFLVENKKNSRKKAVDLFFETWFLSVFICLIFILIKGQNIQLKYIIKQFMPHFLLNNWYVTCYTLFLLIYPYLNMLIVQLNKERHFMIVAVSSVLWIFANFIKKDSFFYSTLILWVTIYFIVAYLKKYFIDFMNNKKLNLIIFSLGILMVILEVFVTNYMGLHISFFNDKVSMWSTNCNPFMIAVAISGLNLFRCINLKSKYINYISGLSLLVYLIHDNELVRIYTRAEIWNKIYNVFGGNSWTHKSVILTIVYSIIFFVITVIISSLYKETIQKKLNKIVEKLYDFICRIWGKIAVRLSEDNN